LAAGQPIREDRIWGAAELETVQRMAAELSFAKIDTVLGRLAGQPAAADLVAASGLSLEAVQRRRQSVAAADGHKKKPRRCRPFDTSSVSTLWTNSFSMAWMSMAGATVSIPLL